MNWIEFFIVLLFAHWVADFALQSNTMAERKNWKNEEKIARNWTKEHPEIPFMSTWKYYLVAHGFIHGAVIYFFTGFTGIALLETFNHIVIDYLKTSEKTNIHQDQFLHLICKISYIIIFLVLGGF